MKTTGIIRRIDDLGRIAIPKEIRRKLRIREGDPLEVFADKEGCVTFKPYQIMEGFPTETIINSMKRLNIQGFIVGRDNQVMAGRETYSLPIDFNMDRWRRYKPLSEGWSAYPLLLEGELVGSIIFKESSQDEYNIIHGIATAVLMSLKV